MSGAKGRRVGGFAIRTVIAAVYVGLVVSGFCRVLSPSPTLQQAYIIDRQGMAIGHLVRAGDLHVNPALPAHLQAALASAPSPEGRYLLTQKTPIGPDDLLDSPQPSETRGNLTFPFPVASELANTGCLDIHSKVRLFTASSEPIPALVASVVCAKSATTCTAFLDVTTEQAKSLSAHAPTDFRLALETPSNCPKVPKPMSPR